MYIDFCVKGINLLINASICGNVNIRNNIPTNKASLTSFNMTYILLLFVLNKVLTISNSSEEGSFLSVGKSDILSDDLSFLRMFINFVK